MSGKLWKLAVSAFILCTSFNMNMFEVQASQKRIENITAKAKSADGHNASNAVDDDETTYWLSPSNSSMSDYMRFIDLDLHGLYQVSSIELTNIEGAYYHYEIYTSQDGVNYDKVAYKNDDRMAAGADKHDIANVKARYVRIQVSYSSKSQEVNIADVNVFGSLIDDKAFEKEPIEVVSFEESDWGSEYKKVEEDTTYANEKTVNEMYDLVGRVVGNDFKNKFIFELREPLHGRDVFELDNKDGKILVRGNNGISMASGFNYYLKNYANVDYNPLFESNLKMPTELPEVEGLLVKDTQYEYRYALNFCTYSYTMSFWNWDEYEAFLDWAAMNGVNLMLDIVGQEEVLRQTLRQFNYTDEEIKEYITGPGYFAWFYMQNMYGFGGPLPDNWFEQRTELSRQIHDRMQTYGITPVMQGFSGQVPVDFADKNGDALTVNPGGWPGFQRPYMLKTALSEDDVANGKQDYFRIVGDAFYKAQNDIYGNITKYYAVDPFHEGGNISGTGLDIVQIYNIVQKQMIEHDEDAVWVMQQWQWGINEEKLSGLYKKDQAIVLDLQSDIRSQASPMENQGVPWIWNMLHNFGGRMGLDGEPENVSQNITEAYNNSNYMKGIGITPEAINNSPMVYELLFDMTWSKDPINYREWVQDYANRRYGGTTDEIQEAWNILMNTAYAKKDSYYQGASESVINAKPADTINSASSWGHSDIKYDKKEFEKVVTLFAESYGELKESPAFIYDFVDVTKQMLANSAQEYHPIMVQAYQDKDIETFKKISEHFLDLIKMQDQVLANTEEFLLGNWIDQSRTMLEDQDDWSKDLFELNARALITTWGPMKNANGGGLMDYSNRQWAGLTSDYYYPRWEKWIRDRVEALEHNTTPVNNDWFMYGWKWANQKSDQGDAFTTEVRHDNLGELALEAFDKYSVTNMDTFVESATTQKRVNLALSKSVEANVEGNDTATLTDGDTDKGWKASAGVREATLTVDLGAINQVQVIAFSLQQIANTFPMQYSIDVYNGSEWINDVVQSGNEGITSKNEADYKGLVSKVRYHFSTTDGSDLPEIKELFVYGTAQKPTDYVNVARSAAATGSESKAAPETPSAVIDGNDKVGFVSANGATPAWVKVELPEEKRVDKVVLKFEPGVYDRSYAFRFIAVDGEGKETLLLERTEEDVTVQQQTKYEFDVHANIKYVRIDILKAKVPSSGGNAWPLIAEIELLQEQEKELKTENIALNKTAMSSTDAQSGNEPVKAVDGNEKSLWISNNGTMPTDLRIDLGKECYVQDARLVFETKGRAFQIKVTTENAIGDKKTVLDLSKTSETLGKEYSIPVNDSIQYITVEFLGSSNPNATPWPAIAELEVYGVPKNIAGNADIHSNIEGVDLLKLQDNDITTTASLTGASEKELVYQFDRSYDINALELYKASNGASKFTIEYANNDDNYKRIADYTGNTADKQRALYEFDDAVFADRIRIRFINETIELQEIKLYEANVSEHLRTYLLQVEKQLNNVIIGEYAGNYKQSEKDKVIALLHDVNQAIDAGVNSQQVDSFISEMKVAMNNFLLHGYVSIDRNALSVAMMKTETLLKVLEDGSYEDGKIKLQEIYETSNIILNSYKVTQEQLNQTCKDLMLIYDEVFQMMNLMDQFMVVSNTSKSLLMNAVIGEYEGQYPQRAYDVLYKALKTAEEAIHNDSVEDKQAVIDTLVQANEVFANALITIDFTAMDALMLSVDSLDKTLYDRDDIDTMRILYDEMKGINRKAITQQQVDDFVSKLQLTLGDMRILDRSDLVDAIASAKQLKETEYTSSSWKSFKKAFEHAMDVYANDSLTQKEIEEATSDLKKAQAALEINLEKTALQELIKKAEAFEKADYTTATWNNLQVALREVKIVLEEAVEQKQLDQAYAQLAQTIDQLKPYVKQPGESSDHENGNSTSPDGNDDHESSKGDTVTGDVSNVAGLLVIVIGAGAIMYYLKRRKKK